MSDTPETDAETMQDEWDHVDTDFGPFAPSTMVSADFARGLERERDEARKDLEFRRGLEKVQEQYLETASRERDEARAERDEQVRLTLQCDEKRVQSARERDEMLEALMKIEDVFVDGDDTYEGWRTMGNIARAALEGKV